MDTQNLIQKIIDDANAIFIYCDVNNKIAFCNKRTQGLISEKKEEMIGQDLIEFLYRKDNQVMNQQMFKAIIDDSFKYARPNNFEGIIVDIKGNKRFISWDITPISSDAAAVQGVLFIGIDITESKEKEDALKKIDEPIKNIFSQIKDYGLYASNLDGNITYYGMGSEALFGWGKNEIIFKNISTLHTPDDLKTKLSFILEQTRRFGRHEEEEINLRKRNGETFPAILTSVQFLDSKANLTGYLFIAKDITERKRMEYQMFQSEKLIALGQLAAGMAHEINNPLFVIAGRVEIILQQKKLPGDIKTDLKIVTEQADRIRKLVDRILKFARHAPMRLEALDINNVIDNVLPLVSYQKLLDAKIKMEKEYCVDLRPVSGDLNQLQEVFLNLLMNACQAMPEGGRLLIKTVNSSGHFAEIHISDSGPGISEENLKNLFMPFFSTKNDGTGLGLSICHNIISSHHGTIEVKTAPNQGTTFIVKLPFV